MPADTQRVAIVTGAARGIGAATASRLAADGMAVAVLDLDETNCVRTVDAITEAGGRAVAVGADVSNAEQVEAAVEKVVAELGPPGVLVNNAGVIRDNLLFKMSEDDWDTVLGIHLRGSFLMSRAAQQHMVEQQFGRIISLSSSSALGNRGQANYSAAKAGLQGFTKTLAIELGQFGITVNAVAPGFIATDMTKATAARLGVDFDELMELRAAQNPGPPDRAAGRRGARYLVPGQRGGRLRLRPGDLRGGRPAVLTEAEAGGQAAGPDDIRRRAGELLDAHDPAGTPRLDFLRARFDAGLAWVHYPPGLGGLGAPRALQPVADAELAAAGAPDNDPRRIGIGLGMAAPTILAFGTPEQQQRWLRPLWTGEEVWCQLFSEPGAGSDLAGLATRAVRDGDGTPGGDAPGGGWRITGQKVWTSMAHQARWAILVARTDPDVPKHAGLSYFAIDMTAPGVEVRPLRQLTGEAEFNEVFLADVPVPDTDRIGAVGDGWRVAQATLMNERVAIGGGTLPREGGMIGGVAATWRDRPELRTPGLHDRLLRLWVDSEVARIAGTRLRQQLAAGQPGPEGSAAKLVFARLNQEISALEVELAGGEGLRYDDWTARRPEASNFYGRGPGFRYLRARGNSIEGGTSEILRNIIAERVLGLPPEIRVDKDLPWKDLPR